MILGLLIYLSLGLLFVIIVNYLKPFSSELRPDELPIFVALSIILWPFFLYELLKGD